MILPAGWLPEVTVDDVLRGQGADPAVIRARRPALVAEAGRALAAGLEMVHPAVQVARRPVRELRHERLLVEGGALSGALVARHLGKCESLAVAVCTIGGELEAEVSRRLAEEPSQALALDGLANAAVDHLAARVCQELGQEAIGAGLIASTPLSPGAEEWPVDIAQTELFALVDADRIGVRLTENSLMLPRKSVSFVIGFGKEAGQAQPCDLCSLRECCRYRAGT